MSKQLPTIITAVRNFRKKTGGVHTHDVFELCGLSTAEFDRLPVEAKMTITMMANTIMAAEREL